MLIGVDIDNIVNNLTEAVLKVYNEDWNDNLTINNITDYCIDKFIKPECEEFYKYFSDDRVWDLISAINVEAVQWLIDNYDVVFVTATAPQNLARKRNFLESHFKNINLYKNLISCYRKQLIKVDFLIDDGTHNLIGGDYIGLCIDYPWNRDFIGLRFNDVKEIVDWIK